MLAIRGSRSATRNKKLAPSARKVGEDNLGWLRRHWPEKDLDKLRLLLIGGTTPVHFRLRVAQSHLRHDMSPSHWSHVVLVAPQAGPLKCKAWEVDLDLRNGRLYPPDNNGLTPCKLADYAKPRAFPNIAWLTVDAPHEEVLSELNLDAYNHQRAVLDGVALMHAWLGYVWGVGDAINPLTRELGIPSAAVADVLISATGLDLTPGVASRTSSPEAIWQAAKWWHFEKDADPSLKERELSGAFHVEHSLVVPSQKR